jgi:flavin reductase (DIM6/NTAB) family NADH-FMN oxidoreductase RutF
VANPKRNINALVSLFPLPVTLVTAADERGRPNVATASFVGMVCLRPRMVSLSLLHTTYSCGLVVTTGKFGLNIPDGHLLWQTDQAGMLSGREEEDKLQRLGLTTFLGPKTGVPLIDQCPVNIECLVRERLSFNDNETFLAEVQSVLCDETLLTPDQGKIDFKKIELFVFNQGEYWSLFERIGRYGFSRQGESHVDRLSETR